LVFYNHLLLIATFICDKLKYIMLWN